MNSPLVNGLKTNCWTLIAPALCPIIVILFGLPPKEEILSLKKLLTDLEIYLEYDNNIEQHIDPTFLIDSSEYDKLLVNIQRKDQQCLIEGIDVFIDDNNDNCRAVHKAGVETLQFGTLFTKKLKNIERVESWQDVYTFVQNKVKNEN